MSTDSIRRSRLGLLLAAVLLAMLVACGRENPPQAQKGRVSGTVVVGASGAGWGSAVPLDRLPQSGSSSSVPSGAAGADERAAAWSLDESALDFVPGELIVRFAGGLQAAALPALEAAGQTLILERSLAAESVLLYRAPGLDKAATLAAARALNARADVLYAHPNYIYHPALAPNDPEYDRQWHYQALDMEGAWDISTGDANVVVAVLDSGIISTHPDFAGRLLPGYDFITREDMANDGDGRDPDPYDDVDTGEGYHGTHVAGTIGAATNNGVGIAGVDWNAKILPVRVLGMGGGSLADIADALIWAVGGSVTGVPTNTNPADVVNLSLGGGADSCAQFMQDVLDIATQFAIVVAAAGNTNSNAAGFQPANCEGLITVGATEFAGERSYYSNFGSAVDVMAPGGDMTNDLFDPGTPDGVLSLWFDGSFDYNYMQGTSMAAPHVTGIVALMKALDPSVDFERALAALRASATPLSDSACDGPGTPSRDLFSEDCGAGLINAALALEYIDTGQLPPPDGALAFRPTTLNLGETASEAAFEITNVGDAIVNWTIPRAEEALDNPAEVSDATVFLEPISGQLAPAESQSLNLRIDRDQLTADGFYRIWLVFEVAGQPDQLYQVRFTRSDATVPQLRGPMVVAAFQEDESGALITSGEQQSAGVITDFSFEVEPGLNLLGAWSDENDNDVVDAGDFVGFADTFVNVPGGAHVTGLSLRVDPVFEEPGAAYLDRIRLLESLRGAP